MYNAVDPAIELIGDPLHPHETALRGLQGWQQWVDRWEQGYESMRVTPDVIVALDCEHVSRWSRSPPRRAGGANR